MIRRITIYMMAIAVVMFMAKTALSTVNPTETLRQTINEVLDIIKKPEMHDPAKKQPLFEEVERKIKTIFDFSEFSARTVGPQWRTFTQEQKDRFIEAFSELLRATYIEKLDDYSGEKVNFMGEVLSTKGDKAEVQTTIMMKEKEIPVSYRMLIKNGAWRVYDVRIENVSLVENYRGQFKDILMKGNAEELIKTVETKAADIRRENKTAK